MVRILPNHFLSGSTLAGLVDYSLIFTLKLIKNLYKQTYLMKFIILKINLFYYITSLAFLYTYSTN